MVYIKPIPFNLFYEQNLVLLTIVPRNKYQVPGSAFQVPKCVTYTKTAFSLHKKHEEGDSRDGGQTRSICSFY